MTQSFILCADDFGLDVAIDHAIIQLVEAGRINAISCMSGGMSWQQSGGFLRQMQSRHTALVYGKPFSIGLHLTFTEYQPVGAMLRLAPAGTLPQIGRLIQQAVLGRLDFAEIMAEAEQQMAAFIAVMGVPPTHIDGHQHVHILPTIRHATIALAQRYGCLVRNPRTRWRDAVNGKAQLSKAMIINLCAAGFMAQLRRAGLKHNECFYGLHDFNPATDIHALYARWLENLPPNSMINCHPAHESKQSASTFHDPIAAWRVYEHKYLASKNLPVQF